MMINKKLQDLKPSATLSIKAKATELKNQGVPIINLSAGEPDLDTPDHIKKAAYDALLAGKTRYEPVAGVPALRKALAKKLSSENGIKAESSEIIVTNGGKQALHEVFECCIEKGDEVIIPSPYLSLIHI